MKLKDWLAAQNPPVTQSAFAARVGRDPSTVTKWMLDEVVPDSTTMRRILEETKGQVTPNDFYGLSTPDQNAPLETLPPQPMSGSPASKNSRNGSKQPSDDSRTSTAKNEAA